MTGDSFWRGVHRHLAAGRSVFLAVVAEHTRHSPGSQGARIYLPVDGDPIGTIGGGIMEAQLIERARRELGSAGSAMLAEMHDLHHRPRRAAHRLGGEPSGLICAGRQTNVYYLARPQRDLEVLSRWLAAVDSDQHAVLTIDQVRGLALTKSPVDLERPATRVLRSADSWCYEEESLNRRRLVIVGGGHCGQALAETMAGLDYRVRLRDTRQQVIGSDRLTAWRQIAIEQMPSFERAADGIELPEITPLVVMTSNLDSDVDSLVGAVRYPLPFIGIMGAAAKLAAIRQQLAERGVAASDVARLIAPVGLDIGSRTPPEIAISVAAQLIKERHRWQV